MEIEVAASPRASSRGLLPRFVATHKPYDPPGRTKPDETMWVPAGWYTAASWRARNEMGSGSPPPAGTSSSRPASTSSLVVPVGYDHVTDLAWPRATSAAPVDEITRPSGTITLSAGPFQRNAGPASTPSSRHVTDAEDDAATERRRPPSTNVMAPSAGGGPRPWHVERSAVPAPAGSVAVPAPADNVDVPAPAGNVVGAAPVERSPDAHPADRTSTVDAATRAQALRRTGRLVPYTCPTVNDRAHPRPMRTFQIRGATRAIGRSA